jgi:hypothetical protein
VITYENIQSIWQVLLRFGVVGGFVGGIIGAVVGPWITHRYTRKRERDARVRSISEHYIEVAHPAERNKRIDLGEFWRIGTLQDLGAAELSRHELRRVCDQIVLRGLTDPRKREESKVFKDKRRDLLTLLRWASREGVSLHDGDKLIQIYLQERGTMFKDE